MKKILTFLLSCIMILSVLALVSCEKNVVETNDTDIVDTDFVEETLSPEEQAIIDYINTYDPRETATSYDPSVNISDADYGGYEFKFLNSSEIFYMYIYLDPDLSGDVLDDACFARNLEVEQQFNITITEDSHHYSDLASYAKTLILADEDAYDAMYIPASDLTPLISENLFYDLLEIEELKIGNIWWDQPLITRNIVEERLFYATSDLNLMAFEGIWAMYFNEDMMLELGLDLPFDLALNGKWTYDALNQYCSAAANLNGDKSFAFDVDGNSTYGLVNSNTSGYLAYGMGAEFCSRDENGRYHFTATTDPEFLSVWEGIISLFGPEDGRVICTSGEDLEDNGYYGVFKAERALFIHGELKGATMLREWDGNFGLLPQPKFDESQETYNSNIFYNCLSFCIPHTNTNLERTGVIVDYLTYLSYAEVMPRYYDIHVALKALGRQESIDVLALIRGTRGCEVAVPFGWTSGLPSALHKLAKANEYSLVSTLETYREQVAANIDKTYSEYPKYIHVGE